MSSPLHNMAAFVDLATREPDRPAVSDGQRRLTIGETAAWAAGVAHGILEADPKGTAPVPVLVDRSVCSVVALFGVLMAGRAIASIDSREPVAYTDTTIHRLGATVILDGTRDGVARSATDVPVVRVASVGRSTPFLTPVADDAVALVVFTSGSTGLPKGVASDVAGFNRAYEPYLEWIGTKQYTHMPVLAPLGWAVGISMVVYTVPQGVEVVLRDPSQDTARESADWVDEHAFEFLYLTPSLARSWALQLPPGRRFESVRDVISGGEAISWIDIDRLRGIVSREATILVSYGASEEPTGLQFLIPPDMPLGIGMVPLGLPIRPELVRLVPIDDEAGSPCEIVFTASTCTGYWNDPERTADRFRVGDDGQLVWRSGDLATVGDDGNWVHQGRVDLLVKINGKLVEPAAPERVLTQVPWLSSAVVMPHVVSSGATRLIAHLEIPDAQCPDPDELWATLRRQLPEHLVPSMFVRHDSFPLTVRGKVDRRALQGEPLVPWRSSRQRKPAGELELVVTSITGSVLGIGSISPDDDVWELGCDSLAAIEIVAALNDLGFGELGIADLIDASTPAAIAERLEFPVYDRGPGDAAVLNRHGTRPPLWAFAGAGGSPLSFRALAAELGEEQPVMAIEAHAIHKPGKVDRSVEAAVRRFLPVVQAGQPTGPYTVLGHSAGALIAYEVAQRLHAEGHEVRAILVDMGPGAKLLRLPADALPAEYLAEGLTLLQRLRRGLARRLRVGATLCGWRSRDARRRYGVFFEIQSRFVRRYQPRRGQFEVAVIEQVGGSCGDGWAPLVDQLDIHFVSGDHNAMLQQPHVPGLATVVAEVLQRGQVEEQRL